MLTTKLLADSTEGSPQEAAASPMGSNAGRGVAAEQRALETGPYRGPGGTVGGMDSPAGMALGDNPEMLGDISMDGLEVPPEPSEGFEERFRAANAAALATPVPSIFPGPLLAAEAVSERAVHTFGAFCGSH